MFFEGPSFITRPFWLRMVTGLSFVVLAVLLAHVVWLSVDRPINSPIFLAAMILTAWLCGLRITIITAIISGFAIKYFFVQPYHSFIGDRQDIVRITVFVAEGILLAWLIQKVRVANDRLKESHEELSALTEYQRTLREAEQKRMAREIHDELGQALTGLKMNVRLLNRRLTDHEEAEANVPESLSELEKMIDGTISSVRRISTELRPSILDDFGLVAAIEWQAKEFERGSEIACIFRSDTNDLDLGSEANTAVFRILQEALTNVARHAKANKVNITLSTPGDDVVLTIRDNGKGVDRSIPRKLTLGILGMQERSRLIGGELTVGLAGGKGTEVRLRIPKKGASVGPEKDTYDTSTARRRSYDSTAGIEAVIKS